jgi:hypothetical protein
MSEHLNEVWGVWSMKPSSGKRSWPNMCLTVEVRMGVWSVVNGEIKTVEKEN